MGAAAIIALIGSLAGPAIQLVQKLFPGLKTDSANNTLKKNTVMEALLPILQALATAGKTPGSVIPSELETAIEAILASLQQIPGALVPPTPTVVPVGTDTGKTYQITGTMLVK